MKNSMTYKRGDWYRVIRETTYGSWVTDCIGRATHDSDVCGLGIDLLMVPQLHRRNYSLYFYPDEVEPITEEAAAQHLFMLENNNA